MKFGHTKQSIAQDHGVGPRTVDNWRAWGWLPAPLKLGTELQSRVRWSDDHVAALDAILMGLATKPATTATVTETVIKAGATKAKATGIAAGCKSRRSRRK